ncbi:MAG: hypothetical protein RL154_1497 [Pseudomonadota bacterium]|jgi:hypothetical protein
MTILIVFATLALLGMAIYKKQLLYAYLALGCSAIFLISIWRDYVESEHTNKMIAKFDSYDQIWCVDGAFSVKSAKISKSDGWIRNGNYISNEDTKLHIKQCKDQL